MSAPVIVTVDDESPINMIQDPDAAQIWVVPGKDGTGIQLYGDGSVETYADLPVLTGNNAGAAMLVEATGLLYIWNGSSWTDEANGVPFQGPEGDQGRGITGISVSGNNLVFSMSQSPTTETVAVPAITAAQAAATAAAASATAAAGSATTAGNAKTATEAARDTATTAAANAGAAATAADAAKTAAVNAKTAAESAATSAAGSATAASGSASSANTSASAASGSASDALASKNAAAASAAAAATSASDAAAAKTDAQSARDIAVSSATAADASADAALISESNASTSASAASGSATAAGNSATAAGNSATAAATSETNAATSETDAATSATNAAASETNAGNAEANAAGSAAAASTSETNAGTSATDAAASADEAEYWAGEAAETVGSGIPNATTTTKGGVQLSDTTGEVGGTWDHMVVNGWADKADLVGGKVPGSQLPSLATTESFVVADTAARLALTCETGDIAIQTGNPGRGSYILQGADPSSATDWVLMNTPDAAVSSVNGFTGAVVLGKGDVGLGNADNTSDANKPVSTATQTALDGKVPTSRTLSAGTGLSGGGDLTANRTIALSSGSQTSLGKADTAVQPSRTISTGTGLTGGGDLSANRTLALTAGAQASLEKADTSVQQVATPMVLYGTDGAGAQGLSYLAYGPTGGDDQYTVAMRDDAGRLQSAAGATGLDVVNFAQLAAAQQVAVNAQTGTTYTLVLGDASKAVECSNAAAITLTVPPNSSVGFPVGTVIEVTQIGAGQVTLAPGSGVTLNNAAGLKTRVQWSSVVLRKRATDTWLVTGDATA